ncbi:ABC transporter permease [Streptomyces nigra]|uniref:ABC transporter permease n=1 Tax=Streptomyces nigra TaxID=1827580 RepID=UPI00380E9F05
MKLAADNGLPGIGRVGIWFNDPGNWWGDNGLLGYAGEHLAYTIVVVITAALAAIPLGLVIGHTGRGATWVAGLANASRAVPTLGLLILLIVAVSPHIHIDQGWGSAVPAGSVPYLVPVLFVLVLVAVPPLLTSTYAGVRSLDPAIREAAAGTGMTASQVVLKVELPCALPLIMSGLRSATLQVIATLTVAAYAPLVGGLGRLIVDGQQDLGDLRYGYPAMVAAGISVAVLALVVDLLLQALQLKLVSPGITSKDARHRGTLATHRSRVRGSRAAG